MHQMSTTIYDNKYLEDQIESLLIQESSILQQLQDTRGRRLKCENLLSIWNNCLSDPVARDLTNNIVSTFNAVYPVTTTTSNSV
jgi:flagellar biosynthesis/type III secretory pathway chaperone